MYWLRYCVVFVFLFAVCNGLNEDRGWLNTYDASAKQAPVWSGSGQTPGARKDAITWVHEIDGDKRLYFFGGVGIDGTAKSLNDLWYYSYFTGKWTQVPPPNGITLGNNVGNFGGAAFGGYKPSAWPASRSGAAFWYVSGVLYMFGGYGRISPAQDGTLYDFWRFDCATHLWEYLGVDSIGPGWPAARYMPIFFQYTSKLYMRFGANVNSAGVVTSIHNDEWSFLLTGTSWSQSPTVAGSEDIPPRYDASVTSLLGVPYFFGGKNATGKFSDMWKFNTLTAKYEAIFGSTNPPDSIKSGIYPLGVPVGVGELQVGGRTGSSLWADSARNLVWVFGGVRSTGVGSGAVCDDVFYYDQSIDSVVFKQADSAGAPAGLPTKRSNTLTWTLTSTFSPADDEFFQYGGEGNVVTNIQSDMWNYITKTDDSCTAVTKPLGSSFCKSSEWKVPAPGASTTRNNDVGVANSIHFPPAWDGTVTTAGWQISGTIKVDYSIRLEKSSKLYVSSGCFSLGATGKVEIHVLSAQVADIMPGNKTVVTVEQSQSCGTQISKPSNGVTYKIYNDNRQLYNALDGCAIWTTASETTQNVVTVISNLDLGNCDLCAIRDPIKPFVGSTCIQPAVTPNTVQYAFTTKKRAVLDLTGYAIIPNMFLQIHPDNSFTIASDEVLDVKGGGIVFLFDMAGTSFGTLQGCVNLNPSNNKYNTPGSIYVYILSNSGVDYDGTRTVGRLDPGSPTNPSLCPIPSGTTSLTLLLESPFSGCTTFSVHWNTSGYIIADVSCAPPVAPIPPTAPSGGPTAPTPLAPTTPVAPSGGPTAPTPLAPEPMFPGPSDPVSPSPCGEAPLLHKPSNSPMQCIDGPTQEFKLPDAVAGTQFNLEAISDVVSGMTINFRTFSTSITLQDSPWTLGGTIVFEFDWTQRLVGRVIINGCVVYNSPQVIIRILNYPLKGDRSHFEIFEVGEIKTNNLPCNANFTNEMTQAPVTVQFYPTQNDQSQWDANPPTTAGALCGFPVHYDATTGSYKITPDYSGCSPLDGITNNGGDNAIFIIIGVVGFLIIVAIVITVVIVKQRKKIKTLKRQNSQVMVVSNKIKSPAENGKKGKKSKDSGAAEPGSAYGAMPASASDKKKKRRSALVEPEEVSDETKFAAVREQATKGFKPEWMIPFEDLKFDKKIGQGAFGMVYRGKWNQTKIAIKQSTMMSVEEDNIEDFKKEAILMLSLRPHPNVIQVLGITVHQTNVYMIMEYCAKGSLDSLFGKNELTLDRKLKIIAGCAAGVSHLHDNKIVHRDLASRNILLTEAYQPKISDFGMSRMVSEFERKGTTASNVGPIKFMAPESLASKTYSPETDVYTFGVVVTEILTEKEPFEEIDLLEAGVRIRDGSLKPEIPPECPAFLAELCEKCWSMDPSERPTAKQISSILSQNIVDDESESSSSSGGDDNDDKSNEDKSNED